MSLPILGERRHKPEGGYAIHSIFLTQQGEGSHLGRLAVFVRFTGCNVWSGIEKHRLRDKTRHSACAAICDTEFKGCDKAMLGGIYDPVTLTAVVKNLAKPYNGRYRGFVVLTGGEPGLQLDEQLVDHLHYEGLYVACETNGTLKLPTNLDWVTLSPKYPLPPVRRVYDEIKLLSIYAPEYLPQAERLVLCRDVYTPNGSPIEASRWIQPTMIDGPYGPNTRLELRRTIDLCKQNQKWRLGIQAHKVWEVL